MAGEMMHYIGIDVYEHRCIVAIKEGSSKEVLVQTGFLNNTKGIKRFIKMLKSEGYIPATAVCNFTSTYWVLLHEMLEDARINALVAHPTPANVLIQTTGQIDAEHLVEFGRLDSIPELFVPNQHIKDMRVLVKTRLNILKTTTSCKSRIETVVSRYTHQKPRYTPDGMKWLQALPVEEIDRMVIDSDLEMINLLSGHMERLNHQITALVNHIPI